MQAEDFHDQVRPGLVAMLPRLMRFAGLLVGERDEGIALLGRALNRMLAEQHRYQRGTALDGWAFGEIYRHWLKELRDHANPVVQMKAEDEGFERLFHIEGAALDSETASFLGNLPPPHRLTLLLVYGERFDYDDAARVLDVSAETIATRLVRITATLADRLGAAAQEPAFAGIQALYPEAARAAS